MDPEIMDFIETILVYKLPHLTRQEILTMLALDAVELKQTRFFKRSHKKRESEAARKAARKVVKMDIWKAANKKACGWSAG